MSSTPEQKKQIWRSIPETMKAEVMNNLENVKQLIERFSLKVDDE